ncbi:MAG: hypothetical protein N2557_00470 [Hydrogenophilus sp.]|nr:hypothetical protein [Hydrogenophilus sp.]
MEFGVGREGRREVEERREKRGSSRREVPGDGIKKPGRRGVRDGEE